MICVHGFWMLAQLSAALRRGLTQQAPDCEDEELFVSEMHANRRLKRLVL